MIPAPFTGDILRQIITASRLMPAEAIARDLGWDLPRLARVARDHRIDLLVPEVVTAPIKPSHVKPEPLTPPDAPVSRKRCRNRQTPEVPYLTLNLKPNLAEVVQHQSVIRLMAQSLVLGRAITFVMHDQAMLKCVAARFDAASLRAGSPKQSEARLNEQEKRDIAHLADRHGLTKSMVGNAFLEFIIANELWDDALGGEAS
jgi:hypothetical protein